MHVGINKVLAKTCRTFSLFCSIVVELRKKIWDLIESVSEGFLTYFFIALTVARSGVLMHENPCLIPI